MLLHDGETRPPGRSSHDRSTAAPPTLKYLGTNLLQSTKYFKVLPIRAIPEDLLYSSYIITAVFRWNISGTSVKRLLNLVLLVLSFVLHIN